MLRFVISDVFLVFVQVAPSDIGFVSAGILWEVENDHVKDRRAEYFKRHVLTGDKSSV